MRRALVIAAIAILAVSGPVAAARGGNAAGTGMTLTSTRYTVSATYPGITCGTEDGENVRTWAGSISGSFAASVVLCDATTVAGSPGSEGVYIYAQVKGSSAVVTITDGLGVVWPAHLQSVAQNVWTYGLCLSYPKEYAAGWIDPATGFSWVGTLPSGSYTGTIATTSRQVSLEYGSQMAALLPLYACA